MNGSSYTISTNRNYNYSVQTNDNGATVQGYLRVHTLPTTPSISMSGGVGNNPILTFAGGGSNVDHYVLKIEYNFGSGFGGPYYVNPANNPYTDPNVAITKIGGDLVARYSVKAVDNLGYESSYSSTVSTNGQSLWKSSDGNDTDAEFNYELSSNYPNPFNPTTSINYQIKENGNVNIIVYDALGRMVKELVNDAKQPGRYTVQFDGSNHTSGIYFVRMRINNFNAVKKIILAK